MVKLGFIGEGYSEVLFFKSSLFQNLLNELQISFVPEPINAMGQDRLRIKLDEFRANLADEGANLIVILTDLDNAQTKTRKIENIGTRKNQWIILSVKEFEAWLLADSVLMQEVLKSPNFEFKYPENEQEPFETIRKLLLEYTQKGIGREKKRLFVQKCMNNGFPIQRAAAHPHCHSARYFLNKLSNINLQQL